MVINKEDEKAEEMKNGKESEAGFTVKDKRKIGKEDEAPAEKAPAEEASTNEAPADDAPADESHVSEASTNEASTHEDISDKGSAEEYPPIDFMSFIMSLSTSALIYMGEVPDPVDNEKKKIIPMAKQMIDLISMLNDKTKGNLTDDEEKYMENILFELKMVFVKATAK
jgi:uncharacterized protein DUF1844